MTEPQDNQIFISQTTFAVDALSWSEKILIEKINMLDNDERGCHAGSKFLADFLRVKETAMRNMLWKLVKKGFLIRIGFDGHNRGYRSTLHRCEPSQKSDSSKVIEPSQFYDKPSQKSDSSDNNRHKKVAVQAENDQKEPSQFYDDRLRDKEVNLNLNNINNSGSNNLTRTHAQTAVAAATANSPPKKSQWSELTKSEKRMSLNEFIEHLETEFPEKDVKHIAKKLRDYCKANNLDLHRERLKGWVENEGLELTDAEFEKAFGEKNTCSAKEAELLLAKKYKKI